MTTAELIGRAVGTAQPFYLHSTGVDLSPTICAALEADGIHDDDRGIFWIQVGAVSIPCEMKILLPGVEAIIHCMNFDLWHGDICRSAHERLTVEMKMKHFVNI